MGRVRTQAVVLAVAVAAGPVRAAPLNLVAPADNAPFTGRGLPGGGLATAIVRAAFNASGREIAMTYLPRQRAYRIAARGDVAAIFPLTNTKARSREMYYSQPLHTQLTRAWVLPDGRVTIENRGDLRGLTGCLPDGHAPTNATRGLYANGATRRMKPSSLRACFRLLRRGRVDFVEAGWLGGRAAAQAVFGQLHRVRPADHVLARTALYLLVPKERPRARQILDAFNSGLKRIKRSRVHSRLVTAYARRAGRG